MYPNFVVWFRVFSVGQGRPAFLIDFTFNRLSMKLFKTGNIDVVVKDCQSYFVIDLPSSVF